MDLRTTNGGATGTSLLVSNAGTGIGIELINGNPASTSEGLKVEHAAGTKAVFVDNAGTGVGIDVFNGNPAGTGNAISIAQAGGGDGIFIDNAGSGKGANIMNLDPGNTEPGLFVSHAGLAPAAQFGIEDNNGNTMATVLAANLGAGSAANFAIEDEIVGKINTMPAVRVTSNGKGPGIDVNIGNTTIGADANTEPAVLAYHGGMGFAGYFRTDNVLSFSPTVGISAEGAGNGLHIVTPAVAGISSETSLFVEQEGFSSISTGGRAAHFDLTDTSTGADSAVLITSSATSSAHSALRVSAASTSNLAGTFEGDVEISSDLTVDESITAASALVTGTLDVATIINGTATIDNATINMDLGVLGTATISDLVVTTSITAPAKAFKIDHPLQPDDMFLLHNSIESNERVNIYSGNISTDEEGYAVVTLPDYMSSLNGHFKYQLTVLDKSFAQAIIWEEINTANNTFTIKTNEPNIKVSWQVTGTRIDKWALENPMQVEVAK